MIKVLNNYGGTLTKEQRILPGEYEDVDPRLFGLAEYLVSNGHAVRIDEPLPTVAPESVVYVRVDDEPEATIEEVTPEEPKRAAKRKK